MIASTALLLLIIGLLNCFKFSVKADKLFCGLSLLAVLSLIFWFFNEIFSLKEQTFSFTWNSSPSGDIKVDIISNTYNCEIFFPFLVITFLAICKNFCFRYEEKRCRYNALLLFNLLSLLFMITSNNFVQLLSAVFLVDIFAVISAKNMPVCNRFIISNLLADMMIFMLLTLINGRINSLDIREIINYKNMGYHIDFIAILGFISILMKMGFFPFQIGLVSLRNLRFHRLQNILCLFSPVCALILLLKFSPLWASSSYFLPCLDIFFIITLSWSVFRATTTEDLRMKVIYWLIMFYALLLELLRFHGFVWDWRFSKLLLADYLMLEGVYLLYYHSGRKALLSQMTALKTISKPLIYFSLLIISLAIFSLINDLEMLYNNRNRYFIWSYAILFLLSFCGSLHLICFVGKTKKYEIKKILNAGSLSLFIFIVISMCADLVLQINWKSPVFWLMSAVFLTLTLSGLSSPLCRFSQNKKLQQLDWLEKIYRFLFISLLQNIGRLLWLIIDWKLVEKFVTETILKIWQTSLRIFRTIQNSLFWRVFFIATILLVMLVLIPYIKEKT